MNNIIYSIFRPNLKAISCSRILFGIFLIVFIQPLFGQDTIAPIITVPAKDTSFTCGTTNDLISKLTLWYNNAGGAQATDNSGSVTFQGNVSLAQAVAIFNNSLDTLCGNKQKVKVIFTAIDASGNISLPTTASFFTTDTTGPSHNSVPNVQYNCVVGIRDTLISWIRKKAGYNATDQCSNFVNWINFQYSISSAGIVIQSGGGSIANGPYPTIPNGICNWRLNINFFVVDECGNQTITPGTTSFTVIDNVAPVFISPPTDITVNCDQIPSPPTIMVIDYCDQSVVPVLTQSSTQSSDVSMCGNHSYLITRTWTATDKCGNQASIIQVVKVVDDKAPTYNTNPTVSISCKQYSQFPDNIYLYGIMDNCSKVLSNFVDVIKTTGCTTVVDRKYSLTDVCGNSTSYNQVVNVIQNVVPIIITPAKNEEYDCQTQENIEGKFTAWLLNKAGSVVNASCGPISYFAAIKGSYDKNNPTTFPGTSPTSLPTQVCPTGFPGYLRYLEVDFVYFDTCGNVTVTSGVFGVSDRKKPVITECPQSITVTTDINDCSSTISLKVPKAVDDCIESESPIVKKVIANITSQNPGSPESIVDTVFLRLGPFNPSLSNPLANGILNVKLKNLDIDDVTEFFYIRGEDGVIIGQTPISSGQCSSINFDLMIDQNKISTWIQDGYIDLRFEPNVVIGQPVLSINHICSQSTIETTISYEIDIINTISKSYQINSQNPIALSNADSLKIILPNGMHTVKFNFTDCAKNIGVCEVAINIQDKVKPVITCPSNIMSTLSKSVCKDTISLPIGFKVIENCRGNKLYNNLSPISLEAALLSFTFNEVTGTFLARNKQFVFTGLFPIVHMDLAVKLDITFYGDNGHLGEYFDIIGPGGYVIGRTNIRSGSEPCGLVKTSLEIPKNIFNSWIVGGQFTIVAIPANLATSEGGGINPCSPISIGQTLDNESYIQANLSYSDALFTLSSTGSTTFLNQQIQITNNQTDIILNSGKSILTLQTSDQAGNTGTCSFEVFVKDNETPKAKCKNAVVFIHPSGLETYKIKLSELENGSTDNCGIVNTAIIPSEFDCSMVNTDVPVLFIVEDAQGNKDTCNTIVKVKPTELIPTFSAGLCTNDTLKLFSNVPVATVPNTYSFYWKGPANIEFFTRNPFIPGADDGFNGTYLLTVTGFNGCTSTGSLLVNIKPLTNPELNANNINLCENEDLILSTTTYSGNIFYEWYEGVFPNGVLLKETESPEFILRPSTGVHFYYVIARGPDCKSNSSALKKITVLKDPVATVNNIFLSPCEGDNIILGTSVSNVNYTYHWTGPSGYNESGQNPKVITNANDSHAGKYLLVIKNGQCISDTAVTNVAIFEKPIKPSISSADIFCQGATFNLIAINSANSEKYEWYKNDMLFTVTQDNTLIIPNAQIQLQGTWKVKAIKGNCSSEFSGNKVIAIDNLLEIGATNSGPVCVGDSISLLATFVPNATYIWQGPVSNIPAISNPTVLGVPGDYSVTITTPTLCQNNASTTVSVISVPEITALSNDSKQCMDIGQSINFFPSIFPNSNEYTYKWTANNGFLSTLKNPVIQNVSIKDTGVYILTVFNKNCPSKPVKTTVKFNLNPAKPIIETQPFYCEGDTISINTNSILTGSEYNWFTPLGQLNTNIGKLVIPNASILNDGNYSLQIKKDGCTSETSLVSNLMVRKKPQKPLIESNSPICFGDTLKLKTNSIPNANYFWNGPNFNSTISNPFINPVNKSNAGSYKLYIEQDGCFSDTTVSSNIVVKDEITTPMFVNTVYNACQTVNNGVELCFDPNTIQANGIYKIFSSPTQVLIKESNQVCNLISDLSGFQTGSNFLYAVSNIGNCKSLPSPQIILNINTPPNITAEAIEDIVIACPGEFVQVISKHGPPVVNIKWTALNSSNFISDQNAIAPTISGLISGKNVVFLDYSIDGCQNFSRDTITIYVEFLPDALNDEITLNYGEIGKVEFLKNDVFPDLKVVTIIEEPKFGTYSIDGNNLLTYIPDPRFLDKIIIKYKICAEFCSNLCDEAAININFNDDIPCKPPSIITPNSDGINDFFVVPCLDGNNFPFNRLVIFNEWGQEVFFGNPYRNDWDGSFGGNSLPVGTYYYILEIGDGRKPINGFLILQR